MIPRKHYDVAKVVEDQMRQLWEVRPLERTAKGQPKSSRSLHQKLGPLQACVQTVATKDGVDVIMLRRGCYTALTQSIQTHTDGVPVRIVDPDPTEEKEPEQLNMGEQHG